MTKEEWIRACVTLKVPRSGNRAIDNLIKHARSQDILMMAMKIHYENTITNDLDHNGGIDVGHLAYDDVVGLSDAVCKLDDLEKFVFEDEEEDRKENGDRCNERP